MDKINKIAIDILTTINRRENKAKGKARDDLRLALLVVFLLPPFYSNFLHKTFVPLTCCRRLPLPLCQFGVPILTSRSRYVSLESVFVSLRSSFLIVCLFWDYFPVAVENFPSWLFYVVYQSLGCYCCSNLGISGGASCL